MGRWIDRQKATDLEVVGLNPDCRDHFNASFDTVKPGYEVVTTKLRACQVTETKVPQ